MTKYRLKDQDLQKALEKAAPGFSKALERDFGTTCDKNHSLIFVGVKDNDRNTYVESIIPDFWIEKVEDYDPDKWNKYPEITPPEGELMRIELSIDGRVLHFCAAYEKGLWIDTNYGSELWQEETAKNLNIRFRPWDDATEP